ncbi:hypothetical protein [Rhizobium fabae]|uniref:Restriction endonuclease type IV Mrr domain-containing protein n=1 Tax=Rhizobium fabae TaxID=573179 RepID=A0A7W6FLZ7_9HYPH|nr:hypothetical protein [Rhizobium fabae]MBB3918667.1 hypothetical protein [Rhizobium fabae]
MPDITQAFAPPAYWQQFEDLTVGVARVVFGDPVPQKVGRHGQSQGGLDVLLTAEDGRKIGIQCKRRDELDHENRPKVGGVITREILAQAIKDVETHPANLDLFIFATTAKPDTIIQNQAAVISGDRKKAGKFAVLIWSWGDYDAALNRDDRLQNEYYRTVAQSLTAVERDTMMLALFAEAFLRPAFRDRLSCEHPDNFKRAVENTQRVLATGELVDREGRRVRRLAGGMRILSDAGLRSGMETVSARLDDFRTKLVNAERVGKVSQQSGWFMFHDGDIQDELEAARREVVTSLNLVLSQRGLALLPER